jgi:predicted alpha/beta-hydrolase family hydrolase
MQRWANKLAAIGAVTLFDYPYMREGKKRPDPLPRLVAAHREALADARGVFGGPAILIGKSLGARVGCHLALQEAVAAVICLGYPLCGGGDPTKLRAEVLRAMTAPVLFVQGTRDRLCPLELLESVRQEMKAENELYIVEGGDHSLQVSKSRLTASAETQNDIDERILEAVRNFVATHVR